MNLGSVQPLEGPASGRVYGWPFYLMFLGFPLWWALGISAFIWPVLAVPMALSLLQRRSVAAPRGFGIWLLFLLWMVGSATQLTDVGRGIPWAYRAGTYLAATILFLYVYNAPRERLSDRRVVITLAIFWMIVTAGGFLGAIAPRFEFRSPMELVLPARLAGNDFVQALIHPAAAQISTFLGYEAPRPKAPFEYTNDWGAVFALTAPFLILGWGLVRGPVWRWTTRLFLIASVVPVVVSLNRGLWLSLGIGLLYAALRFAAAGRDRPLFGLAIGLGLVAVLVVFTPLRDVLEARFENPHSNERRATLYAQASAAVLGSPVLGYGSPNPSEIDPNLPSLGTQGQLWLVLYSQGIPGLLLYLGWYLIAYWQSLRGSSSVAFWCNVVILIALIQLPYYGQLATQIQVTMVAAALGMRELRARAESTPAIVASEERT